MLNSSNNDDNDEWKWELVDGENEEENRGNIVELEDHPFAEIEGLQPVMRLPDEPSTLDFVQLYLTDNIFNILVTETNRYAHHFQLLMVKLDHPIQENGLLLHFLKWKKLLVLFF